MRIAIVPIPRQSHLNAVFGVASVLRSRGHQLLALGPSLSQSPYVRDALGELGVEAQDVPMAWELEPASMEIREKLCHDEPSQLRGYTAWYGELPRMLPDLRERLSKWKADVVLLDSMVLVAAAASAAVGIPYVSVHATVGMVAPPGIPSLRFTVEEVGRKALRDMYEGLDVPVPTSRYLDVISPYLNIVWHTKAFLGDAIDPAARLVGPTMIRPELTATAVRLSRDAARRSGRRIAFVAFGSFANHYLDLYERILAACEARSLTTLVSCPDYIYERIATPNTIQTTAQLDALELADVFIGGIGGTSLMEALCFGVPLLALPHAGDHGLTAHFIERAGIGLRLPHTAATDAIESSLSRLLDDDQYRANAARIAADYRAQRGPETAADLVEQIGDS